MLQMSMDQAGAKELAKKLAQAFNSKESKLSHGASLNVVAKLSGHEDWNALAATLKEGGTLDIGAKQNDVGSQIEEFRYSFMEWITSLANDPLPVDRFIKGAVPDDRPYLAFGGSSKGIMVAWTPKNAEEGTCQMIKADHLGHAGGAFALAMLRQIVSDNEVVKRILELDYEVSDGNIVFKDSGKNGCPHCAVDAAYRAAGKEPPALEFIRVFGHLILFSDDLAKRKLKILHVCDQSIHDVEFDERFLLEGGNTSGLKVGDKVICASGLLRKAQDEFSDDFVEGEVAGFRRTDEHGVLAVISNKAHVTPMEVEPDSLLAVKTLKKTRLQTRHSH